MERARAEDSFNAITNVMMAKGFSVMDMRLMGFDGCNTMSREQEGIV